MTASGSPTPTGRAPPPGCATTSAPQADDTDGEDGEEGQEKHQIEKRRHQVSPGRGRDGRIPGAPRPWACGREPRGDPWPGGGHRPDPIFACNAHLARIGTLLS